ncbi:MAG TPA: hypothetical protein VM165_18750 [Planctomycetaceae bacterium]|nr:hypothetical protein [Planctomycetaceae bacterium]
MIPLALRFAILFVACSLAGRAAPVHAQAGDAAVPSTGGLAIFPDASFDAMFRKFAPPATDFSPVYSWDAHMGLDVTVLRTGPGAISFRSTFQSVGTENLDSQIGVGGTGYILGLAYVHTLSPDFRLSAGLVHLSSHLTRDLDDKLDEIREAGGSVPSVNDPSEYNVFFFAVYRQVSTWPFHPEFEIAIEPVNFRFNGSTPGTVRPVYMSSRWTMWRGTGKSIVAGTQHEIGVNPFNYFSLSFQLDGRSRPEGRLQFFVSASSGHGLHVSPNVGALRDGVALGIRMAFGA